MKLRRMTWGPTMISLLMLIASCGGGGSGHSADPASGAPAIANGSLTITGWSHSPVFPSSQPLRPIAAASAVDPTAWFNWAERRFAQYFPGHRENQSWAPYIYRYYPETNTYLAVDGIDVRMLGPAFGPNIIAVGTLPQFVCNVFPGECIPPTADAGAAQEVPVGSLVTLDGRGSTDPANEPLKFSWNLTLRPFGSVASLSAANTDQPTLIPDVEGTYTAVLVVNNGVHVSAPQSVTITAMSGRR